MDDQIILNLAEHIRKEILNFQNLKPKDYEKDISRRLESTKHFQSVLKESDKCSKSTDRAMKLSFELIDLI